MRVEILFNVYMKNLNNKQIQWNVSTLGSDISTGVYTRTAGKYIFSFKIIFLNKTNSLKIVFKLVIFIRIDTFQMI